MVNALNLFFVSLWHLVDVMEEVKTISVMEGDSVTLHTGVTEVQKYLIIHWTFGSTRLAEVNNLTQTNSTYDGPDGRFRDRLYLDDTGSLIITNTRTTDSGLYKLTLITRETNYKSFHVTVNAHLPIPVISTSSLLSFSSSSSSSSSISNCSVVCSVKNVSAVSLSWYKGNSLLSSISVSDLSISHSLPLEVEYQDNNTYSCVINDFFINQTTLLDINTLCQHEGPLVTLIMLLSAAGSLLILALLMIICFCRNNRKPDNKAETHAEEITYADPTFHKRRAPQPCTEEETYADPKFYKRKAPKSHTEEIAYTYTTF